MSPHDHGKTLNQTAASAASSLPTCQSRLLRRTRLNRSFAMDTNIHLWSLSAPAGFGKSTLLQDVREQYSGPVTSLNVDTTTLRRGTLLKKFEQHSTAGKAGATELLTIDDIHLLAGTEALQDLELLVHTAGPHRKIVLAGRGEPIVNLTSFRLDGTICELGADDLRFRSWEVEELFHKVFRVTAPPSELAALASATNGWAAALQLYRHATQRSTDTARRQQLELLRRSRLESVRSYLLSNVLSGLTAGLQGFLISASPLGRMTPQLCNRFLSRIDSANVLDALVEQQLFTSREDDGSYRFHEVFRSFLESEFERTTDEATRTERYLFAAELLSAVGATGDALRAYAIGGDVERATGLLDSLGALRNASTTDGLLRLPDGLLSDHRLRLAHAFRLVRDGYPTRALREFRDVANDSQILEIRTEAERQAQRIHRWIVPENQPVGCDDPMGQLRNRLGGASVDPTAHILVRAFDALLSGDPESAVRTCNAIADQLEQKDDPGVAHIATEAVRTIAAWMIDGLDPTDDLRTLRDRADRQGAGWVTRILTAVTFGFPETDDLPTLESLDRLERDASTSSEGWSPALAKLFILLGAACGTLREIDEAAVAYCAATAVQSQLQVGAPALAEWSVVAKHLAAARTQKSAYAPTPDEFRFVRDSRSPIAAIYRSNTAKLDEHGANAGKVFHETGDSELSDFLRFHERQITSAHTDPVVAAAPAAGQLRIRAFGAFELSFNGLPVHLDSLRPKARSILQMLALHAGKPLHRELILEAMWPDDDPLTSAKRLHVAVSTIRHELGGAGTFLVRKGETYQFGAIGTSLDSDLIDFDAAARRFAASSRTEARSEAHLGNAREVAAMYSGALLPEGGSASWIVEQRESRRQSFVRAISTLAKHAFQDGDWPHVCQYVDRGLYEDRFLDEFWHLKIDALDRAGQAAEATRVRVAYDALLDELGVAPAAR